ncbi:hypothetical protein D3C74_359380 [compost metagenome]
MNPSPNPSAMRSYPRRSVVSVDFRPLSGKPSCICRKGKVHIVKIAIHRMVVSQGFLVTTRLHAFSLVFSFLLPDHFLSQRFSRDGLMWSPAAANIAGTRMIAMRTATNTLIAAASPIIVMKGICTTDNPTSAIITVSPANTTEPPAVALA